MTSSNNKKVKIFGVPLDLGTNKLGVDLGPRAIRHAGLIEALEFNNICYEDYGNLSININNTKSNNLSTADFRKEISIISERLAGLTFEAMQSGYIPIILGGDHSVSIGSIAGASKEAEKMLAKTWAGKKLAGYRSLAPADRVAAVDALRRLSQLAHDLPEIAEIEINPLTVISICNE